MSDFIYYYWDLVPRFQKKVKISDLWREGYHITKDGFEIDLSDMETSHLINTINYFKDSCDVQPLQDELDKRS